MSITEQSKLITQLMKPPAEIRERIKLLTSQLPKKNVRDNFKRGNKDPALLTYTAVIQSQINILNWVLNL